MKEGKKIFLILVGLVLAVMITAITAITIEERKTVNILDDYSILYTDEKYMEHLYIDNVELIKQEISCGYAVIEMFSNWAGGTITEESLYDEYGKVVTSTGKSFEKEMKKRFPEFKTTMYPYLSNTEMIDKIYNTLKSGIPVPFQWAAKYNDIWTLHYSLITGIDIPNNRITILNPYGYEENLTLKEFTDRTSFKAYEDMPIYLRLAFAFGIFERNTIFAVER
ncbi:C39 family peptidase [Acetivibrio clariflavus]|uniref:Peptidase C39-like domain-containing protein n=1 Tax=Acetivibrio clariflavus (strain DSM 19732 / NBRC 101661 / EBR45) TaxID=720554 RepID=G8LYJ2_ACECE|nr:C39 family peptidase [Acetivibrio clariflavus]AEV69980.1 hypothetical protein Clocl_3498 [Acetivibrio clariflavus DSM 19732]